ncbi:hypothetical protein ACS0TY_000392 [Phlomoides rotata]
MVRYLLLQSSGILRRCHAIGVSNYLLSGGWRRSFSSSAAWKRIGTHSGKFHCDEALNCFMIRRTENFYGADIIRTRDSMVLEKLDAVLDVGGVYNSSRDRYDHHQEGFEEVFGYGFETKLSSAGSVYKRYGKEIISKEVKLDPDHCDVHRLFVTIYKNFIEIWINPLRKRMKLAGNELLECIHFHAKSWLPARSVVMNSLLTRKNVDSNGEIIVQSLGSFTFLNLRRK